MNALVHRRDVLKDRIANAIALLVLILIGAMALVGPAGLLAWGENAAQLEEHEARLTQLRERREELENRVALLNPDHVDPDFGSELVRRGLGVAHPDEYIIELDPPQ